MKNLKDLLKYSLFFTVFILMMTSCVKDVEMDQMKEIELMPTAVIELVNFTLEADLVAYEQQEPISFDKEVSFEVVTNDLKENVNSLDLVFDYLNSLPRTFNATLYFIDSRNRVQSLVSFEIPPGSKEIPVRSEIVETYTGEALITLNQSSVIKIKMEMQPGPGTSEGQLSLQTSAVYNFVF